MPVPVGPYVVSLPIAYGADPVGWIGTPVGNTGAHRASRPIFRVAGDSKNHWSDQGDESCTEPSHDTLSTDFLRNDLVLTF